MIAISIRHGSCSFELHGQVIRALEEVDLEVKHGQFILLGGANGSGKTTLLGLIDGELEPTTGMVVVHGTPGRRGSRKWRDSVFHIRQDPTAATAPALSVYENLFVADQTSSNRSRASRLEHYRGLLSTVGLDHRLHQQCAALSGGERQVLAFLVAKLRLAPIVLLDEPIASLDAGRSQSCLGLIQELSNAGRTVLMVTHNVDLLASLGDRTIILSQGRISYDEMAQSRSQVAILDAILASMRSGEEYAHRIAPHQL